MKKFLFCFLSIFLLTGCMNIERQAFMDSYMMYIQKHQDAAPVQFNLPGISETEWTTEAPALGFKPAGGDITVNFKTESNWTAREVPLTKAGSWISLSKTKGAPGIVDLVISAEKNNTYEARKTSVVITSGDQKYTLIISQDPIKDYDYFFIENVSNASTTVKLEQVGEAPDISLEYSFDGENWEEFTAEGVNLTADAPKAYFRAESENPAFAGGTSAYNRFTASNDEAFLKVGGDILYLLKNDGQVSELPDYAFYFLFTDNRQIVDAEALELPSLTLSKYCYAGMFSVCASLEKAPELPATKLAEDCYNSMFSGCSRLVNAPELPATSLAENCYLSMFSNCSSLVDAPELPATSLAENCYYSMFNYCTSLVDAPELPATSLAENCYYSMFNYCTSLVNAPTKLPAMELANNCYTYMFYKCSSLENAPALPATKLADYCYSGMFRNCTSLVNAPELPAENLAENCYYEMFEDCERLVDAPALPATELASNCYAAMFNGCSSLVKAPALPATNLAASCYLDMFYSCSNLVNAPKLPATKLSQACYSNMFENCTSLEIAPTLPAKTLENNISYYYNMFKGCSKLSSVTMYATDFNDECIKGMLNGAGTEASNPVFYVDPTIINNNPYLSSAFGGDNSRFAIIPYRPESSLSGAFSVSEDKVVFFSKGNLQATIDATGAPTAWKFAANQYDYIGEGGANKTIGTAAGDIDLFGWSTASTTYRISTSTDNSDYSGDFVDWGKKVGNGNTWRTLSTEEWQYLFNTRTMTNGGARYETLTSSGITFENILFKGVVLFPDDFIEQETWKTNYTTWEALNNAGLVFLPITGYREENKIYSSSFRGLYWSSSACGNNSAYRIKIEDESVSTESYDKRYYGYSVRLVADESQQVDGTESYSNHNPDWFNTYK